MYPVYVKGVRPNGTKVQVAGKVSLGLEIHVSEENRCVFISNRLSFSFGIALVMLVNCQNTELQWSLRKRMSGTLNTYLCDTHISSVGVYCDPGI